ncbi:MAG TPA: hypothetical protein VIJ00_19935 [Nakamurella sp.]
MRQVCGGTNGCRTRRSMNPKAASSTPETVSAPSVFGDVQPSLAAFWMPNTSAAKPVTAATAPGRSSRASPDRAGPVRGSSTSAATIAPIPMGTLIRKIICQPAQVVIRPPTMTPAAMPRPPTAPHIARPFVRCAPA